MSFSRCALLASCMTTLACGPMLSSRNKSPEPQTGASVRYVGLYTSGFEQSRFRACTHSGTVSGKPWRVVFMDSALAERDVQLRRLQARNVSDADLGAPLVAVVIGHVGPEAPKKLGVDPRRVLVVERLLVLREPRGWRERMNFANPCGSMDREDPISPSRLASLSAHP